MRPPDFLSRLRGPRCDNYSMQIGAHVSTRGGIDQAVDNALAIGAEVFQTHPTSPQQWGTPRLDDEILQRYLDKYARSGLGGHFFHAIYLINLATPKEPHLRQSIGSLVHYMELAGTLGATGVVFHPGSHLGAGLAAMLPQVQEALREILGRTTSPARLLIENSAGSGGCVGCGFEEVGGMLQACDDPRLGVCLDTQHMFASGYDVRTPETREASLAAFGRDIGFERLVAIHANDSLKPLSSNVDRHANIGDGEIGLDALSMLLHDPRLGAVPWILEVPGIERGGPDLDQINRLRQCAGLEPAVAGALAK